MIKYSNKHSHKISGTLPTDNSLFFAFQSLQISIFYTKRKKISEPKSFGFLMALYLFLLSLNNILTHCLREWLSEEWKEMSIHPYSTGKKRPIFSHHVPWIRAWKSDWPWSLHFPYWKGYFFHYMPRSNGMLMFPHIYHAWSKSTNFFPPWAEVKSY